MSDIVERLRDSDTTRRIGESYADVHDRRQADRDEAADEITRLTARLKELEGALNPFADESLWSGPDHEFVTVKRSDCDRARAVSIKGER